MPSKLESLEKTVSRTLLYISKLKKERDDLEKRLREGVGKTVSAGAPRTAAQVRKLLDENQRLLADRKAVRSRIRAIIKNIDRAKK